MGTSTPDPSVALLMFTCNDLEAAVRRIERLRNHVDEVVLVDSSDPRVLARSHRRLQELAVRVHRAIPTGYVDLLRPYGVSQVSSAWTLLLDTDEELSPRLTGRLGFPGDLDAYWVPRYELQLGAYTRQLRFFRTSAYAPGPATYGHPEIHGNVGHLPPGEFLIHHRDFTTYLGAPDRSEGLLTIESYERPFTRRMARELLAFGGACSYRGPTWSIIGPTHLDDELSPPASRLLLWLEFFRRWATTRNLRFARADRAYGLARWNFARLLSTEVRRFRVEVAREVRRAGGMLRYLGFDDFRYLDRLTATFRWNRKGPQVLEELLRYRHDSGRPIPSLAA
ncbi:MAG: hypothetical protein L3K15_06680 [Thermoplasmata archaeon]|nr:hypothetical protein [Thermoplasmata archaeon]